MSFGSLFVGLLLGLSNFIVNARTVVDLIIEDFYKCEDVLNQTVSLTFQPKTLFAPQVVDVTLTTPIDLGNDLKTSINIELENESEGKNWQHLVNIEDDFCRVIQLYVGPLAYDMEYSMGIPRQACPIPKGHYHAVNYAMDFNTSRLQDIPVGKLRVTNKFLEKRDRNVIQCSVFIMSYRN